MKTVRALLVCNVTLSCVPEGRYCHALQQACSLNVRINRQGVNQQYLWAGGLTRYRTCTEPPPAEPVGGWPNTVLDLHRATTTTVSFTSTRSNRHFVHFWCFVYLINSSDCTSVLCLSVCLSVCLSATVSLLRA